MPRFPDEITYSDKYHDDTYEYRHVTLTKPALNAMAHITGGRRLLDENEWRDLGVQQSRGWVHYHYHRPEMHILLFRRRLDFEANRNAAGARAPRRPTPSAVGGGATRVDAAGMPIVSEAFRAMCIPGLSRAPSRLAVALSTSSVVLGLRAAKCRGHTRSSMLLCA
eukprot:CAMPEP_0170336154 /NCGR_PEP_ID=MMETSP0116_2-20130129/69119_1 /TAXON_ID=400756 /ORGANISM="Durinskia baltica, Strain CSIRO CS-38" /LENGTH=165 /DNA_ID=CAMNT_0010589541 /DNA_START=79 /DNA_END=573 /DNA_ORIENTATION=-